VGTAGVLVSWAAGALERGTKKSVSGRRRLFWTSTYIQTAQSAAASRKAVRKSIGQKRDLFGWLLCMAVRQGIISRGGREVTAIPGESDFAFAGSVLV
jgi:hypothetical protein